MTANIGWKLLWNVNSPFLPVTSVKSTVGGENLWNPSKAHTAAQSRVKMWSIQILHEPKVVSYTEWMLIHLTKLNDTDLFIHSKAKLTPGCTRF